MNGIVDRDHVWSATWPLDTQLQNKSNGTGQTHIGEKQLLVMWGGPHTETGNMKTAVASFTGLLYYVSNSHWVGSHAAVSISAVSAFGASFASFGSVILFLVISCGNQSQPSFCLTIVIDDGLFMIWKLSPRLAMGVTSLSPIFWKA